MVALMAPTAGAFFLLLNKTHLALYVSTAIIGVCTGAITSISVSTTTELFGTKNFSVNHNVVVANIPVGSLLFGYLAAFVYHKGGHHGHGKCLGMECYRSTFVIWEMVFQQESHLYVQKKRWFIAQICARLNQINEYDANMMIAMSHPYLNYAVISDGGLMKVQGEGGVREEDERWKGHIRNFGRPDKDIFSNIVIQKDEVQESGGIYSMSLWL
ncbi:hypothetical protein JHK85_041407 [Glycine max]|nr:hypothetical protein JHK85_041407 [Glycine max]